MTDNRKSWLKKWGTRIVYAAIAVGVGLFAQPIKSAFFNPQEAVAKLALEHKTDIEKVNTKIDTVSQHIRSEVKAVSDKEAVDIKEVGERSKVNEARNEEILRTLSLINERLEKIGDKIDDLK